MSDQEVFRGLAAGLGLEGEALDRVVAFRELVLEENERQNLTRLVSPKEFFEGHLLDAVEVVKCGLIEFPAMDLGSGVGVPGILSAILGGGRWVLAESEGHKADFLRSAVEKLRLDSVEVFSGRGEDYLRDHSVGSIVARAVGPVERIYAWIAKCSTWNTLVLLKGPGWAAEWEKFNLSRHRGRLEVASRHEYSVGEEAKSRMILSLRRTRR